MAFHGDLGAAQSTARTEFGGHGMARRETIVEEPVVSAPFAPDEKFTALYSMPGHLIRRSQQVAVSIFAEELIQFDMTPVQYAVLRAIGAHPGIDATRVSGLVAFDRSTLGDVLDRIESKGWIERQPMAHDRRIRSLFLTEAGHAIEGEAETAVLQVQERILAPLAAEDRTLLIDLLRRLVGLHTGEERYGS